MKPYDWGMYLKKSMRKYTMKRREFLRASFLTGLVSLGGLSSAKRLPMRNKTSSDIEEDAGKRFYKQRKLKEQQTGYFSRSRGNFGTSAGKILPPETGVYLGQTELNTGDIAAFESATGRRVAIAADLSVMSGQEEAGEEGSLRFNVDLARNYWQRGAVVVVGAYEACPGHKPFTVDKLLRGRYDKALKKLASQFREFGEPMFFSTAREPNGVLAPYSGGFGPYGDKGAGWAERTGRGTTEFKPPAGPDGKRDLYAGLGDDKVDDGIERLAAAQRYYYDFFIRREGLTFLTFETMGWVVPTWLSEPEPIARFDTFYRLVADYSDWVSINFYMWTEPENEDTGQANPEPPIEQYLGALSRAMEQVGRLAPDKPVLITELGFAEPNRAEKIRRGLQEIIMRHPQIKGIIQWGGDFAIHPDTSAGSVFRQVIDKYPNFFHSHVRFSDSGD
jgi:hypothetical protein